MRALVLIEITPVAQVKTAQVVVDFEQTEAIGTIAERAMKVAAEQGESQSGDSVIVKAVQFEQ